MTNIFLKFACLIESIIQNIFSADARWFVRRMEIDGIHYKKKKSENMFSYQSI